MIHIEIPEKEEPKCLNDLKQSKGIIYDDLKDSCKDEVEDSLIRLQNGICAYCQKSIIKVKTIEHYIPISKDPSKQLDWDNLIAVCSRHWYLDKHDDEKLFIAVKAEKIVKFY